MISILRAVALGTVLSGAAACSSGDAPLAKPPGAGETVSVPVTDSGAPAPAASRTAPIVGSAAPSGVGADSTAARAPSPRRVVVNGIDLTGIGYDLGDPKAPVVLVNFSDFGCPFCGSFARQTYPSIDAEFVKTGKVFFKYVPFVMGMFPNGAESARAAECAADEGRFWAMHDRLYDTQREWKQSRDPNAEVFSREAKAIGLDAAKFAACYASGRTDARTATSSGRAGQLGVRATPSFFANDQLIEGALPLPQFRQVLTEASR